MLDLVQMETFLAVAEERSFSRAAARLHRTQPAVSQAIAKLEGELGEILFERSSRDGTLTDAGEVLREYAAKLLNLRSDAEGALTELRALHRGRLNLAENEQTCLYLCRCWMSFGGRIRGSNWRCSGHWRAGFRMRC